MSKSTKVIVHEKLARESHQLVVQTIHQILAAMEVHVYSAVNETTTQQKQFQVHLN